MYYLFLQEISHGPEFDALPLPGIGKTGIVKRCVGDTPGMASIRIMEFEQQDFLPRHIGKIPPAVIWIVAKDGGGDGGLIFRHIRQHGVFIRYLVDDDQAVGCVFLIRMRAYRPSMQLINNK